jgi:two-component system chemotaxis sensor kinase CheA
VRDPQGASRPSVELEKTSVEPGGEIPQDNSGTLVARVLLDRNSPMKAARAPAGARPHAKGSITGSDPAEFGDDFDGELILQLAPGLDLRALDAELRSAPEVSAVTIQRPGAAAVARAVEEQQKKRSAAGLMVRVDQGKLDNLAGGMGELTVLKARLDEMVNGSVALEGLVHRLGAVVDELQDSVLTMRMVPVGDVFDRFHRLVRDVARSVGKEIDFRIEGRDIELDRAILDEMVEPLVHLLRNAVDHGIEGPVGRIEADKPPRGQLVLRALRERSSVLIQIEDDGRGVDAKKVLARAKKAGISVSATARSITPDDLLRILSHPGFSTAEQITEVSGRGVGMDAVVNRVRALGGAIDIVTLPGHGTTFSIRLPITLAVAQALRVRVAGEDYAIPLTHVAEAVLLERGSVQKRGAASSFVCVAANPCRSCGCAVCWAQKPPVTSLPPSSPRSANGAVLWR